MQISRISLKKRSLSGWIERDGRRMLHIIGMLLKIIGIVLAVILGILVLLLCIVLFCAVKYQADLSCKGTKDSLKINASVKWLFGLLRFKLQLHGENYEWSVKAAWKTILKEESFFQEAEEKVIEEVKEVETAVETVVKEEIEEILKEETLEEETAKKETTQKETTKEDIPSASEEQKMDETSKEEQKKQKKKRPNVILRMRKKIHELIEKMKYTFSNICDKIEVLEKLKDRIVAFIEYEPHRLAYRKVLGTVKICIGHFFPKKIQGDVTFGFLDPYHTGQALAGLSMIYPFIGDNVSITPDFERRMLEGEIFLKGHIRICHVVLLAGRLILSKNVRVTYKHIRKIMKQRAGGT